VATRGGRVLADLFLGAGLREESLSIRAVASR